MSFNYKIYSGEVERGYQLAGGSGIYNPYNAPTLSLQIPHFRDRGFDLGEHVPGFFLGTININISPVQLRLKKADKTLDRVAWSDIIEPETFSFIRCALAYKGYYFAGVLYYPHPETKPRVNAHHFNRIEVLTSPVPGLKYGDKVDVIVRDDAFVEFS